MKKEDTYVMNKCRLVKERLEQIYPARPPLKNVYIALGDVINLIYDDGYYDGANDKGSLPTPVTTIGTNL